MRSLLFVPGDSEKKLEKGLGSGADVLLIDLEDSVAANAKAEARAITAGFITRARALPGRPKLYVRINALDTGLVEADLDGVMVAAPDGIMLPKAEGGADITRLDAKIAVREAAFDLADGATRVIAIATETAGALFGLGSYRGASRRLVGLAWGGEDLSADLGALATKEAGGGWTEPYRIARALNLFGAVAAGVTPIDTVYTNFRDLEGLEAECILTARDGYTAKMAIHPAQVEVINRVYGPSPEAIAAARKVVAAFQAAGDVGVVGVDGEMLDRPHLTKALKVLARIGEA
jgi:citrate lyase subunit beta/citryl-CoA lyase